eukprot:Nk52_evm8s278 gene=Nk52_evmTU8s278
MNLYNTVILLCLVLLLGPPPVDSFPSNVSLRGDLKKLKNDVRRVAQFLMRYDSVDFQSNSSGALRKQKQQKELRRIINLVHDVARVIDNTTNSTSSLTHSHTGEHPPIYLDELDSGATGGYTNEKPSVKLPPFASGDQSERVSGNGTNKTRAEILKRLNSTAVNAINSNISSWSAYYLRLSLLKHDLIGAKVLSEMGGMALLHALFNSTQNSPNEASLPRTHADRRRRSRRGANIMGRLWRGFLRILRIREPTNRKKENPPDNREAEPENKEERPIEMHRDLDPNRDPNSSPKHVPDENFDRLDPSEYGSFFVGSKAIFYDSGLEPSHSNLQDLFNDMQEENQEKYLNTMKQYFKDLIEQQAGDASVAQMTSEAQQKVLSLIEHIGLPGESGVSSSMDTLKKQRLLQLRAELLNDKIDAPILNALGKALKNPQETVQAMVQANLEQQQPLESEENIGEPIASVQSVLKTLPKEAERVVQLTKSLYEFPPTHHFGGGSEKLPEDMLMSNNPLPSLKRIPSLVTQMGILSTLDNPSDLVQHQLAQVDATLTHFTSAARKSTLAASTEVYLRTPLQLLKNFNEVGRQVAGRLIANKKEYYDEESLTGGEALLMKYLDSPSAELSPNPGLVKAIQSLAEKNLQVTLATVYDQISGFPLDPSSSPEKQTIAFHFKQATLDIYGGFQVSQDTIEAMWKRVLAEKDSAYDNKDVREVFTNMQKQSPEEAANYLVTKVATEVKEKFFKQTVGFFSQQDDKSEDYQSDGKASGNEKLMLISNNGQAEPFTKILNGFFIDYIFASVASGKVFFAFDILSDQRFLSWLDVSESYRKDYEEFCDSIKKSVFERVLFKFTRADYDNIPASADLTHVLEAAVDEIQNAVDKKFQKKRIGQIDDSQLKLFEDLVDLKVEALTSTATAERDLINGILRLTQPRMKEVAKSVLEKVQEISSSPGETNSEGEQDFKVSKKDAVAFLSLGSTISQSARVEDVWHNAVNELLVEADVHAAVIGIQYYDSEKYDEISRSLKTHTDKVISDIRSSLREYTKSHLQRSFENSEATHSWAQADIEGISTFVSILQPDPITAMNIVDTIYPEQIYFDYDEVHVERENIIARHTSGFVDIVKQEFWGNVDLEKFDKGGEKAAQHFKQVGEVIQSHAVERINELMRSPELLKLNEDVASLEEMNKFLSQYASFRVDDFLKRAAELLQENFATQLEVKLKEENKEIDEYKESLDKEVIPESFSGFNEGSNIPKIDEPDDETGSDGDWKGMFNTPGDEGSQDEDEGAKAEPSAIMAD